MTELHYQRLCVIHDKYKDMGQEATDALIARGKELIKKYGEENLNNILETEEDFEAAGAFFTYRLVTDKSLYEGDSS